MPSWIEKLPRPLYRRLDTWAQALRMVTDVASPRVLAAIAPSGVRGFVQRLPGEAPETTVPTRHEPRFAWRYVHDSEQLNQLSVRARSAQWDLDRDLPWATSVDPDDPTRPILAGELIDFERVAAAGVRLDDRERARVRQAMLTWTLSQFLHGEQGALYAACQIVESVPSLDCKLFGATQVLDEARHVAAFERYLSSKLSRIYQINDNLFVILDALLADSRWDVKFLGMQIIVEGLAMSSFGTLLKRTREPLLKELLLRVMEDEARHVQFGLIALREIVATQLSEREIAEREDWALQIMILMRNRFYAFEVYEEWFEHALSRQTWREILDASPGMLEFRRLMFGRILRNLRHVGLLGPRIEARYRALGLMEQRAR
jgi:hypothetical protein